MNISESESGEIKIVTIAGRLWGEPEGEGLSDVLIGLKSEGCKKVVIDMAGVSLMNSSGLGSLIAGMKSFREVGGDMKLASANDRIQTILRITKLEKIFKSYPTREAAIESFA